MASGCGMQADFLKTVGNTFAQFHAKMATALLDIRFGGLLRGVKLTPYSESGAYATANSSYDTVRKLFRGLVRPSDVLVDVGCGKGRVINAWLSEGYTNRMIGVELDADVAAETSARLKPYPNVTIVAGDILTHFPEDGALFYLFNPFDARVLEKFKDRLKICLLKRTVREATVVYNNCRHLEVFVADSAWRIQRGKLEHEFAIIHFRGRRVSGAAA